MVRDPTVIRISILDSLTPVAATAKYKDSISINFKNGNPWKEIGTWNAENTLSSGTLMSFEDLICMDRPKK